MPNQDPPFNTSRPMADQADLEEKSGANASGDATGWTRDAKGKYVDWTRPPHRQGGRLNLVLEGEDVTRLPRGELSKRRREYMSLARRHLRRAGPAGI